MTSAGACVPEGSAPPYDAGTTAATASATSKPSLNVMSAPFEDNFDRPDASEATWPAFEAGAGDAGDAAAEADGGASALLPKADAGEAHAAKSNIGSSWIQAKTTAWKIEAGKLCVQDAHNHGIWLNRTLPVNARLEWDATPYSEDGDLKAEVWGDGSSYATGTSYTNATSYLVILGGWKNSLQVMARLNEHGSDRKEIKIDKDADDQRQRPVQKGQTYHFKVERTDGRTVKWSVDGVDYFSWSDPAPLAGQGHDHFGFNEWEVKVCFDNVKVTPL